MPRWLCSVAEPFRFDRFQPGDRVVWASPYYANLAGGVYRYGDGPFTIVAVEPASYVPVADPLETDKSNWATMGHTQYVYVEGHANKYTGAFFRKVPA